MDHWVPQTAYEEVFLPGRILRVYVVDILLHCVPYRVSRVREGH
jgi:hypothetical protein